MPDGRPRGFDPATWARLQAQAVRIGTAVGHRAARNVSRETKRGPNALRYSSAAWDASAAAWTLVSLIDLLGEEAAETEQAGFLRDAIAALQRFIELEQAEIGTPADAAAMTAESTTVSDTVTVTAWASGIRASSPAIRIVACADVDDVPWAGLRPAFGHAMGLGAFRAALADYDRALLVRMPAVRTASDDAWVKAQLDKRAKWYARVAALMGVDAATARSIGRGGPWPAWLEANGLKHLAAAAVR
jgi:hypothetical protein